MSGFWDSYRPPSEVSLVEENVDLLQRKVDYLEGLVIRLKNDVSDLESKLETYNRKSK